MALDEQILEKEDMINETDSKMSMISVYVDQLEERLASFAVARRDITLREEVCKEIEEREIQKSKDCAIMEKKMKEALSSRDELKGLADSMSQERTKLQKEKDELVLERDSLLDEEKSLRQELRVLNDNFLRYEAEVKDTKNALDKAQASIAQKDESINQLKELNKESSLKLEKQLESLEESAVLSSSLQEEVERLEAENERVSALVSALENRVEQVVFETEEKFSKQVTVEAERIEAQKIAEAEKIAAEKVASAESIANEKISEAEKEASEKIAEAEKIAAQRMAEAEEIVAQRIAEAEKIASEKIAEAEILASERIGETEEKSGTVVEPSVLEEKNDVDEEVSLDNDVEESYSSAEEAQPFETQDSEEEDTQSEDIDNSFIPPPPPPLVCDTGNDEEILNDIVPPPPPPLPDTDDEYETDTDFMSDNAEKHSQISISGEEGTEMTFEEDNIPPPPPPPTFIEENFPDSNGFEMDTPPPPPPPPLQQAPTLDEEQVPEYILPEGASWEEEVDDTEVNVEASIIHHPPQMMDGEENFSTNTENKDILTQSTLVEEEIPESAPIIDDESMSTVQDQPEDEGEDVIYFESSAEAEDGDLLKDDMNYIVDSEINETEIDSGSLHHEGRELERDIEIISDYEPDSPPGYFDEEVEDEREENQYGTDYQDKSECDTEAQTVEEDDLEIISDDEPELPPGYFEDHFDDEEKHRSFFDDEKEEEEKDVAIDSPEIPEEETVSEEVVSLESGSPPKRRRVPFRRIRKTFAFLTGVHGLFTPPSKTPKPAFTASREST